jgi:hypothetical protein
MDAAREPSAPRLELTVSGLRWPHHLEPGRALEIAWRDVPVIRRPSVADADLARDDTAWLPLTSTTVEPARLDMNCCAGGGIILSSVATRYQLGLVFHAGSLIAPLSASSPQGTCVKVRSLPRGIQHRAAA